MLPCIIQAAEARHVSQARFQPEMWYALWVWLRVSIHGEVLYLWWWWKALQPAFECDCLLATAYVSRTAHHEWAWGKGLCTTVLSCHWSVWGTAVQSQWTYMLVYGCPGKQAAKVNGAQGHCQLWTWVSGRLHSTGILLDHDSDMCTEKGLSFTAGVAQGRSLSGSCNKNICAQVCQYGFKVDSTGCPTCECDNPCAGFPCNLSELCVAVKDDDCPGFLCPTSPQCKYSSIVTYCTHHTAFWDADSQYFVEKHSVH